MKNQDSQAFLKAFDEMAPKLYRFCLLRVSSKPLAEDLVSQTFLQTWEYVQNGRQVQSYPVFLYQVLRNLISDHWRSKASRTVSIELAAADTLIDAKQSPEEINQNIELRRVLNAIDKLPKEEQDLLHWRYVDGLSAKEIAALSGKKTNAIYVSIFRSVQKLKGVFNNYV